MLGKFLRDEFGATAIEYSLIAGFIALAIIAAVGMTGERLVALFASSHPGAARIRIADRHRYAGRHGSCAELSAWLNP